MRRIVVLVLALVVLGPAMASASAWYRCGHDGVLRAVCCCPSQARHHATPDPDTRVREACCCKVTSFVARASSVRGAPPIAIQVAPPIAGIATLAAPPLGAPIRVAALEQLRAPRGPPDPLFDRHCSRLL